MTEVESRYGTLTVPNTTDDVIGRYLARYGEWGWDEVGFVASVLPKGARVLDVGAYLGTFGLGLAVHKQPGFLCFVEANSSVMPALEENVRRNAGIPTVVLEAMVAGPDAQPRAGRAEAGNRGSTSFAEDAVGEVMVNAPSHISTLAELRNQHGPYDLIKLDVEGLELDILKTDVEHLSRGNTMIWVECNEDRRSLEVAELLLSWGLDLYYFAFPAHNPDNFRCSDSSIFPMAYEAGLLAAPKSVPTLDEALRKHRCILRCIRSVQDLKTALWRTPRWGQAEWSGAETEEIAAMAGHALRGHVFDTYLEPGWRPEDTLWQRLAKTEEGLRGAERLAIGRLEELQAEQKRLEDAQNAVRAVEALALERLAELEEERDRREKAELTLAEASAQTLDRLARFGAERERIVAAAQAATIRAEEAEARALRQELRAEEAEARALQQELRAEEAETGAHRQELRAEEAEAAARRTEDRLSLAQAWIEEVQGSLVWRIGKPFRRLVGKQSKPPKQLRRRRRVP